MIDTEDFKSWCKNDNIEALHTKFCKFALSINKYAGNHAICAELGRFPIDSVSKVNVINYWHRLETKTDVNTGIVSVLKEVYNLCKMHNHIWYNNVKGLLCKNSMGYIHNNPHYFHESHVKISVS